MTAPWLNAATAAAFVGLTPKTLSNLRSLGRGPAYIRYEGGQIVYDQTELERWRETRVAERVDTRDSRRGHLQAVAS